MTDHLGVCAGYADTFKFLCDMAGLPCITVCGKGFDRDGMNGDLHAWNMIWIDGSPYWVDVTWGDNIYEWAGYWYGCPEYYAYFCVDDEAFLRRHTVSTTMNWYVTDHFSAVYPACRDTRYTWFSLQDLVFGNYEEAKEYIRMNLRDGIPYFSMQFTSQEELDRTFNNLITYNLLGDFMQEAGVWYGEYQYYIDYCNMTLFLELR